MAALYQIESKKDIRLADTADATVFTWQSGAQTDITTAGFDTRGYNEFTIRVCLGSVASSGTPKIKEVDDSADNSSFNALASSSTTAQADTDDYKVLRYNMKLGPQSKRYYRVIVSRAGGNATVDAIIVTLKKAGGGKVTDDTTMGNATKQTGPINGAA